MKPRSFSFFALIAAALIGMSCITEAAPPVAVPDATNQRLELFGRAQRSCAVIILSSPEKGRAFSALKLRLSDFCECVAIYTVSQTPEESVKAILANDREQTSMLLDLELKAFGACASK